MIENLFIAFALAMDCFAVSVVCAVILRRRATGIMLRLAFLFGFFQALMPFIGWLLTSRFSQQIQAYDHWIAFGMLALIGGKMIWDSFKEEDESSLNPEGWTTGLLLAVATSIDALAVGITYACTGYETVRSLTAPLVTIGLVSFLMSIAGHLLGARFGEAVNEKVRPELVGGIILLIIGLRILAEHLGFIS
jgi:putative Mn2+ efflux pump MntP